MPLDRKITPAFILEYPKEEGFDAIRDGSKAFMPPHTPHNPKNPAEIWGKFEAGQSYPTGFDVLGQRQDPETGIHIRWFQKFLEGRTLPEQLKEIHEFNEAMQGNRRIIFGWDDYKRVMNHQAEGRVCKHIIVLENRLSIGNTISEPSLGRLYETTDLLIKEEIERIS